MRGTEGGGGGGGRGEGGGGGGGGVGGGVKGRRGEGCADFGFSHLQGEPTWRCVEYRKRQQQC